MIITLPGKVGRRHRGQYLTMLASMLNDFHPEG
jgi:hypothetical protein